MHDNGKPREWVENVNGLGRVGPMHESIKISCVLGGQHHGLVMNNVGP